MKTTSRYALQNLYLDRDQIDTLVATYALTPSSYGEHHLLTTSIFPLYRLSSVVFISCQSFFFTSFACSGYRYGFNGMEKDDEVAGKGNSYTAEFWQYDSRLGRRWNIDPVVKHHESPYAAFANNPIWFIDPSGAATLKFDNTGKVIDRIKSEMNVLVVGDNIKNLGSNECNYKTDRKPFEGTWRQKEKYSGKTVSILQFSNQLQAEEAFEFLAQNIEVEFGYVAVSDFKDQNHRFFITTSHNFSSSVGSRMLIREKLFNESQPVKIIIDIHSHPRNTPYPSGTNDGGGDIGYARKTNELYRLHYVDADTIQYQIYLPGKNKYLDYNENSKIKDFK